MALDANPRSRPGSLLLWIGLLVAVAVIGYLLGMIKNRVEPTIAREPSIEVRTDTREFESLHADLRELRDELTRAGPERDVRTPAGPQKDGDARLIAVLERLEAAIGRLDGAPVGTGSRPRDTALVERLDRELTLQNPGSSVEDGSDAVYAWMEERSKELTAQHALWSIDDVMATYGRPTHVESDNISITLRYEIRRMGEDRGVELRFQATSLRIVYVAVSYF
jgi:hypothetical protein